MKLISTAVTASPQIRRYGAVFTPRFAGVVEGVTSPGLAIDVVSEAISDADSLTLSDLVVRIHHALHSYGCSAGLTAVRLRGNRLEYLHFSTLAMWVYMDDGWWHVPAESQLCMGSAEFGQMLRAVSSRGLPVLGSWPAAKIGAVSVHDRQFPLDRSLAAHSPQFCISRAMLSLGRAGVPESACLISQVAA